MMSDSDRARAEQLVRDAIEHDIDCKCLPSHSIDVCREGLTNLIATAFLTTRQQVITETRALYDCPGCRSTVAFCPQCQATIRQQAREETFKAAYDLLAFAIESGSVLAILGVLMNFKYQSEAIATQTDHAAAP